MTVYSFVRNMDWFATPVGVRYKDAKEYKTFCGGVCSFLALTMILFFSMTELWYFIQGNQYNETIVFENLPFNNSLAYRVTDKQSMIAFQFVATEYAV